MPRYGEIESSCRSRLSQYANWRIAFPDPACAGEPPCRTQQCPCGRVYPRVCGGTDCWSERAHVKDIGVYPRVCGGTIIVTLDYLPGLGLSPRVRGNLYDSACWSNPS